MTFNVTVKASALPLFRVGGNVWEPSLPLYVANCESETPSKRLTLVKVPNGVFLDLAFVGVPFPRYLKAAGLNYSSYQTSCKGRKPLLYGWVRNPALKQSQLTQFDAATLKILQSYPFPSDCEAGQLSVFDLLIKERWHTYLVAIGGGMSVVFDVTLPEISLKPIAQFNGVEAFCGIRLQNGIWGGVYSKKEGTRSLIQIINFEDFKSLQEIPLPTDISLVSLKAIDLEARGQVDWLYGIDKQGEVWSCDLRDLRSIKVKKLKFQLPLANIKDPFYVLKDIHTPGLWVYFNLNSETETHEIAGIFQTLSRGGGLPSVTEQKIKTREYKLIGIRSNRLLLMKKLGASKFSHTILLSDPYHEQDVLLALEKECNLKVIPRPTVHITQKNLSFQYIE